jgi:hypothetical protein
MGCGNSKKQSDVENPGQIGKNKASNKPNNDEDKKP